MSGSIRQWQKGFMPRSRYDIINRYIYSLIDPRDNIKIAYIGQATNVEDRLKKHYKLSGENPAKDDWIIELERCGLKPIVKIEKEVYGSMYMALTYEMAFTVKYRDLGYTILSVREEKINSIVAYVEV